MTYKTETSSSLSDHSARNYSKRASQRWLTGVACALCLTSSATGAFADDYYGEKKAPENQQPAEAEEAAESAEVTEVTEADATEAEPSVDEIPDQAVDTELPVDEEASTPTETAQRKRWNPADWNAYCEARWAKGSWTRACAKRWWKRADWKKYCAVAKQTQASHSNATAPKRPDAARRVRAVKGWQRFCARDWRKWRFAKNWRKHHANAKAKSSETRPAKEHAHQRPTQAPKRQDRKDRERHSK